MSKLEQFVGSPLVSDKRMRFLDDPVFVLGSVALSRRDLIAHDIIASGAMSGLIRKCERYGITTTARLNQIGMLGLAKCAGVGEAMLWAASVLVDAGGYDVTLWIGREDTTFTAAIRRAVQRTRRRKDPAPPQRTGAATGRRSRTTTAPIGVRRPA